MSIDKYLGLKKTVYPSVVNMRIVHSAVKNIFNKILKLSCIQSIIFFINL